MGFSWVLEKGNDDVVCEISNLALKQAHYCRQMTLQEGEFLSRRRWHEYFAYLLPEIDQEECMRLQSMCVDISIHHPEIIAKHIQLNDHAHQVLQAIEQGGFTQILISNSQPKSLDLFIQIVGIERYFPSFHRFRVDTHSQ